MMKVAFLLHFAKMSIFASLIMKNELNSIAEQIFLAHFVICDAKIRAILAKNCIFNEK